MSETVVDPRANIGHSVEMGQVYEDTRSGDIIKLIYLDDDIAVFRDEDEYHRLEKRRMFDFNVGSGRFSLTDENLPHDGPFSRLTAALERFETQDGRKSSHKAEAIREVLSAFSGEDRNLETVPFEDVDGIGSRTAARLRQEGYTTVADVRSASDEELLDIGGVGEKNLGNLRGHVESYS